MNNFKVKHKGLRRLWLAFGHSMRGFQSAWKHEAAVRQEGYLAIVLIILSLFFPVTAVQHVLLIGSIGLVIIVELLNSAIEAVVDRISYDYHELSKRAKDIGSAAVFTALTVAGFTWLLIVWDMF